MIERFFALVIGHALADFALQSEWMARRKNRHLGGSFEPGRVTWPIVMTAHSMIHGGVVWMITGNVYLGLAETCAHMVIDILKCEYVFGIYEDQGLHILCKMAWAIISWAK